MEKTLLLKAEIREQTGSKAAAKVRSESRIPAIIYGHKQKPVAISVNAHDFIEGLHHGTRVFDVQIGRKKETMMVKDLQYDYLGKDVVHADLIRVNVSEMVKVSVPIELKGIAQGTHEGGIVESHTDNFEIECKVTDIPEKIVVSVKELEVGGVIYAVDVELPADTKLVSEPSLLLVTCSLVAAAKSAEEAEEEEPTAPEVITEKKAEDEESAGEES